MIHSFYVENFLSIRDRQEISFATTSDKTVRDFVAVEVKPNVYINKLGVFYGANASGKSNFLFAMEALFYLLYAPQYDKSNEVAKYLPFALCKNKPTTLGVVFFRNGIRYDYEVSYCNTHIISEKLEFYPTRTRADFYTREFIGIDKQPKIKIGGKTKVLSKTRNDIIPELVKVTEKYLNEETINNLSMLATFGLAKTFLRSKIELITP